MGLTASSTGLHTLSGELEILKASPSDKIIALAGNPNVGKSTVFNALTGLHQHTGNWAGKTVETAQGTYLYKETNYILVDIPGTYSLKARSREEEIARDFIKSNSFDAVVVVCDGTCLERNLNLVIQTLEITDRVVLCVNLMDEAERKGININLNKISKKLGIPAIGVCAKNKKGFSALINAVSKVSKNGNPEPYKMTYPEKIETALSFLEKEYTPRHLALAYLEGDAVPQKECEKDALREALSYLEEEGIMQNQLSDILASSIVLRSEEICLDAVSFENPDYRSFDRKIDKILTNKFSGYPIMLLLLAFIFWLTVSGANYPSSLLSSLLMGFEDDLMNILNLINTPKIVSNMLVLGIYRCLAWVVSVMLPPMAIFFPLFTLLEDLGFLPRVAFNLDHIFKKCKTCGKQALTMCMGLGCNAAGVVGCRIIDSPRERLIAILTNALVPCNGRFPTIITVMTIFFAGSLFGGFSSVFSALSLTLVIALGISLTFFLSWLLSKTLLRGTPSVFCMELPPYRKPLIIKTLVRSLFDRTLFVLGRAAAVAAPAGLLIFLMANFKVGGETLLFHLSSFLDPLGRLMGLDGCLLLAFILGFPANEIVMPIAIMAYMSGGVLSEITDLVFLKDLLVSNGWTPITAICTVVFSIAHFPCSTTCLTIYKETKSIKWTALAIFLPTILGMILCILINLIGNLFI